MPQVHFRSIIKSSIIRLDTVFYERSTDFTELGLAIPDLKEVQTFSIKREKASLLRFSWLLELYIEASLPNKSISFMEAIHWARVPSITGALYSSTLYQTAIKRSRPQPCRNWSQQGPLLLVPKVAWYSHITNLREIVPRERKPWQVNRRMNITFFRAYQYTISWALLESSWNGSWHLH